MDVNSNRGFRPSKVREVALFLFTCCFSHTAQSFFGMELMQNTVVDLSMCVCVCEPVEPFAQKWWLEMYTNSYSLRIFTVKKLFTNVSAKKP